MTALEALVQGGFLVTYADRHRRMCYLIIAGFMAAATPLALGRRLGERW